MNNPDEIVEINPSDSAIPKKPERFNQGLLRRFTETTKKLALQGERVQHTHSETDMILFVGKSGNDIIGIRISNDNEEEIQIQHLFMTLIGDTEFYQLSLYYHHGAPIFRDYEEIFWKGSIDPELRRKIEERYPKFIDTIKYTMPGNKHDFTRLTEALEHTTLDKDLLEKTVMHYTYTGNYVRTTQPKQNFLSHHTLGV